MGSKPLDIVKNVGLNLMTGGLYSIGKGILKTIKTGNPTHLLAQGFSLGLGAVGNQVAVDIGGPKAGMAFNAAGALLGAAGAAGAFSSLPGFAPGGVASVAPVGATGATPLVATPTGAIPLASGVAPTGAEVAGASLTGPVSGITAAPAAIGGQGGLGVLAGAPAASGASAATLAPSVVAPAQALVQTPVMQNAASDSFAQSVLNGTGSNSSMITPAAKEAIEKGASSGLRDALILGGVMVGGQLVTGAMGGLFQGKSAEQQLELQALINSQHEAQVQYKNKNNAYAPLLSFT